MGADPLLELYPDFAVRVRRTLEDMRKFHEKGMRVTEALRSMEKQKELYDQGRTTPGKIVTWAQPGDSIHHYGLAVDSCFSGEDPYLAKVPPAIAEDLWVKYGDLAEAHGLVWGGRWLSKTDRPHIQITYGLTLSEIKELYRIGGLKGVWTQLDKIRGV